MRVEEWPHPTGQRDKQPGLPMDTPQSFSGPSHPPKGCFKKLYFIEIPFAMSYLSHASLNNTSLCTNFAS